MTHGLRITQPKAVDYDSSFQRERERERERAGEGKVGGTERERVYYIKQKPETLNLQLEVSPPLQSVLTLISQKSYVVTKIGSHIKGP